MNQLSPRSAWLKGPQASCEPAARSPRVYRLVLLGPPGVGKGTQAEMLSTRLGQCHLSTGDVFRAARSLAARDRAPALTVALEAIARGELAPDDTVMALIRDRMGCVRCQTGFLLDGFPRTIPQAEGLGVILAAERMTLDGVVSYELPLERVVARLGGRRVCPQCRRVYHVEARRPAVAGRCDTCEAQLEQRDDDRPDVIRTRMLRYAARTQPLIDYYAQRGLLRRVDADGRPEAVFARTTALLSTSVLSTSA